MDSRVFSLLICSLSQDRPLISCLLCPGWVLFEDVVGDVGSEVVWPDFFQFDSFSDRVEGCLPFEPQVGISGA